MVQPVVAGVDGSAESLTAVQWAAREAVRRDRPLHLLHAGNWHPRQTDGEPANAAQRHLARRYLRQAEERIRATCPDTRLSDEQVEGPATEALVKAAEQAELLVLGSRGLSGFTGFLVGSVALGVVARATRPVVLVRAGEEAEDEHIPAYEGQPSVRTGYRDVVLGINITEPRDEIIEFAADKPSAALVWAATGASLLVVGHRTADRPVGPRTGPVTHTAIHHVGCPVAVVPHA
ncbi:universal stress protein [Streptomyces sp. NPDC059866]|uniref:universal stress protein n=1 Tax=Streptomyces sp. NPDC059866 TaxID=3346978 RepID=UPI0036682B52